MSASTPEDLAVAFRSVERRRREALGDVDPGALSGLTADVAAPVRAAAALLGLGESAGAGAVADAIAARRADDWDDGTLDQLRQHALAAGAALRRLAAAADEVRDLGEAGGTP